MRPGSVITVRGCGPAGGTAGIAQLRPPDHSSVSGAAPVDMIRSIELVSSAATCSRSRRRLVSVGASHRVVGSVRVVIVFSDQCFRVSVKSQATVDVHRLTGYEVAGCRGQEEEGA